MLVPRSGSLWHRILLHGQIQLVRAELDDLCQGCPSLSNPADLLAFEQRIQTLTQRLHALLAARAVQDSLDSPQLRQATRLLLRSYPKPLKHQGPRPVTLHFSHGPAVVVWLPYYTRGRTRTGRRSKGCFPTLVLLGIYDRCSPSLASDLAQLAALLGSFREAQALLRQRGIALSVNTLRMIAYQYAQRVRAAQQAKKLFTKDSLKGKVVVISTDGGRIRIRKDRKAKTKKGRKRYSTNWREPKVLLIYTVEQKDGQVRLDKSFAPVMDGMLKGPEALFGLLRYYLAQLHVEQAERVLVVADGAKWIWKRVGGLLRSLKVEADKVEELVDFYHAVEHLGKAADAAKCFDAKEKKKWLKKQSHRLREGEVEKVVAELEDMAGKQPSNKTLKAEVGYFVRHGREHKRMEYARMTQLGLPLGSGAMESAVRRVVNLRLKGAGIFWHKTSAEAMLLLRAFAKAGRSQDLDRLAFPCDFHKAA
jgi:hypothetical protein